MTDKQATELAREINAVEDYRFEAELITFSGKPAVSASFVASGITLKRIFQSREEYLRCLEI